MVPPLPKVMTFSAILLASLARVTVVVMRSLRNSSATRERRSALRISLGRPSFLPAILCFIADLLLLGRGGVVLRRVLVLGRFLLGHQVLGARLAVRLPQRLF